MLATTGKNIYKYAPHRILGAQSSQSTGPCKQSRLLSTARYRRCTTNGQNRDCSRDPCSNSRNGIVPPLLGTLSYIVYGKHIARGIPTSEMQNLQSPAVNWAILLASTARIFKKKISDRHQKDMCCVTADHAVRNCLMLTCTGQTRKNICEGARHQEKNAAKPRITGSLLWCQTA